MYKSGFFFKDEEEPEAEYVLMIFGGKKSLRDKVRGNIREIVHDKH